MDEAWIYTDRDELAGDAVRILAELGFHGKQVRSDAGLRPTGPNGTSQRPPAVALVVANGEDAIVGRLADDDDLKDVAIVIAASPERLENPDGLRDGHELILLPLELRELRARIMRARARAHGVETGEIVRVGSLELNLATYQVAIDASPVDFTYMEYELLKFLVTHPGRVFTREALLSRVWGYDYFGGARTVDVHVRRVRAKLGQENAARIKTVRSVGYRFEI
jgi:DNA-binding response OmpR family regulator